MTHIQSQRVRLRITLEQVIKNNPAPLETISGLPSPWPLYLGTVSSLAALAASSLWLALAQHASGRLCPCYRAPLRSCQAADKCCRGTLKPFQTFGFSVGKLACYHLHLIYFFHPPTCCVLVVFLKFYWVKKIFFCSEKKICPCSTLMYIPKRNKVGICKIDTILATDTS